MKYLIYVVLSFLTLIFAAKCEEVGSCAKGFAGDESESFASGANDIIVVEQVDGTLKSTILNVQVCYKSHHWKKVWIRIYKCDTQSDTYNDSIKWRLHDWNLLLSWF